MTGVRPLRAPSGPTTFQSSDFMATSGAKKASVNEASTVTWSRPSVVKTLGSR